MRIRKTIIAAVLAACALVPAAVGASTVSASEHHGTLRVGMAIIGGINDAGFNSLADAGLKKAETKLGVTGKVIVTPQNGNYQGTLQALVNDHNTLVVAVGALWDAALYSVATANTSVRFAIVDGFPTDSKHRIRHLKNVATLQFKSEQSGYVAGVIAGLMEKKHIGAAKHNVIAAVGAIPLPFIIAQMCGYWEGAKSVDKSVKFVDGWVYSFFDPTTAQNLGQKQIHDNNADILFGVADASGFGYYKAASNAHRYAIGFASDQDYLGSYMLTSAEVGIKVAVYRTIKSVVDGMFRPNRHLYTFANGGISYAKNMHHVPANIQRRAARVASKLAAGTIAPNPFCKLPA